MKNVGLVLEGGGMRSPYTSAILDYFLEKEFYIPYVIGASAGAFNAIGYVSRQIGWAVGACYETATNPNSKTFRNILRGKTYIDIDVVFNGYARGKAAFDNEEFMRNEQECVLTTFNCLTGESVYNKKSEGKDALTMARASSSLPFVSKIMMLDGVPNLDGGMSDSMPVKQSMRDGNTKNIVILTKSADFVRKPDRSALLAPLWYPKYPAIHQMLKNRHLIYNADMDFVAQEAEKGNVFLIRPSRAHGVGRMTTDMDLLQKLYDLGLEDAKVLYPQILAWINQ